MEGCRGKRFRFHVWFSVLIKLKPAEHSETPSEWQLSDNCFLGRLKSACSVFVQLEIWWLCYFVPFTCSRRESRCVCKTEDDLFALFGSWSWMRWERWTRDIQIFQSKFSPLHLFSEPELKILTVRFSEAILLLTYLPMHLPNLRVSLSAFTAHSAVVWISVPQRSMC
jgi:hypothetical protein